MPNMQTIARTRYRAHQSAAAVAARAADPAVGPPMVAPRARPSLSHCGGGASTGLNSSLLVPFFSVSSTGISSATYLSRGPPISGVFKPQGGSGNRTSRICAQQAIDPAGSPRRGRRNALRRSAGEAVNLRSRNVE